MMESGTQQKKAVVIYHDNCADGFGAAFIIWRRLKDTAEYIPMNYDATDEERAALVEKCKGKVVYLVDFSFPQEVMLALMDNAEHFYWRDHHKTAFEMWLGHYEREMKYENCNFNHDILLDDNRSGAMLAQDMFGDSWTKDLAAYIDDRDRWQFKLLDTKAVGAGLWAQRPWSFEQWETFCTDEGLAHLKQIGNILLQSEAAQVASSMKSARKVGINGTFGVAVNSNLNISELGNKLCEDPEVHFALIWYMGDKGSIRCSFRSKGSNDVSAIAKRFGGGGHMNAAGCSVDVDTLLNWFV